VLLFFRPSPFRPPQDLFGYTMVLLNNLVTALNLVFIKKTLSDTKLAADTFGVLYYNSLISIPFLLALSVLSGEVGALRTYAHWSNTAFQASFLISALMSFLMNYSTYWCTEVNSALTTSVTGQVKNVLSSFVALSMFGMKATPLLVAGLTIGLLGSIMYAYAVHLQDKAKRAVAAANKAAEANLALQGPVSGGGPVSLTNGSPANSGNGGGVESRPLLLHHARSNAAANHHDDSLMDAKIARLEAGQRSPAVLAAVAAAAVAAGQGQGQPLLNFPSASSMAMAGSPHAHQQHQLHHHLQPHNPPSSPNPLHPYNNPYKSKPN
jgi:hypothetical protein